MWTDMTARMRKEGRREEVVPSTHRRTNVTEVPVAQTTKTHKTGLSQERAIVCLTCQGKTNSMSADRISKIYCNGREENQQIHNFIERQLLTWRAKGTAAQETVCARCYIRNQRDRFADVQLKCKDCKRTLQLGAFTSISIRQWLNKDGHDHIATCYDCQYPPCAMPGCAKRSEHPAPWNSWVKKDDFHRQSNASVDVVQQV